MSGLLVVLDEHGVASAEADSLVERLRYRAPRGLVRWHEDTALLAEAVGDVRRSTRPDPLDSAGGGLVVAADAHLAERRMVASRLRAAGVPLPEDPGDRQLIAAALARWQANALDHLSGEFAFAAWDPAREVLTAAVDQLGARELYYAVRPGRFVVGTELLVVADAASLRGSVDDGSVAQYLLLGSVRHSDDPATIFAGVRRLLPAERLEFGPDGLRVTRYWDLPYDVEMRRHGDPQDYVHEFRATLLDVVADRLDDVPEAVVHLSGGLDSTSVAAAAAALVRVGRISTRLSALCVGYQHIVPDEEPRYAGLAAERIGLPLDVLYADDCVLTQPLTLRAEPITDPATGLSQRIGEATRDRAPFVLSGKGGDELLPPTPLYQVLLQHGPVRAGLLYRWLWTFTGERPSLGGYRHYLRALVGRPDPLQHAMAMPLGDWLDPDFARSVDIEGRWQSLLDGAPEARRHLTQPDVARYFLSAKWAIREELYPASPMGFPDATMPFADLRLLRLVLALPPAPWNRHKRLLREAMAGDLPPELLSRAKTPAPNFSVALLKSTSARWVDNWQASEALSRYVRRERIPLVHGTSDLRNAVVDIRPLFLDAWLRAVPR